MPDNPVDVVCVDHVQAYRVTAIRLTRDEGEAFGRWRLVREVGPLYKDEASANAAARSVGSKIERPFMGPRADKYEVTLADFLTPEEEAETRIGARPDVRIVYSEMGYRKTTGYSLHDLWLARSVKEGRRKLWILERNLGRVRAVCVGDVKRKVEEFGFKCHPVWLCGIRGWAVGEEVTASKPKG